MVRSRIPSLHKTAVEPFHHSCPGTARAGHAVLVFDVFQPLPMETLVAMQLSVILFLHPSRLVKQVPVWPASKAIIPITPCLRSDNRRYPRVSSAFNFATGCYCSNCDSTRPTSSGVRTVRSTLTPSSSDPDSPQPPPHAFGPAGQSRPLASAPLTGAATIRGGRQGLRRWGDAQTCRVVLECNKNNQLCVSMCRRRRGFFRG